MKLTVGILCRNHGTSSFDAAFSQLKSILEAIKESALRDIIEARMMMRINRRAKDNSTISPSLDSLLTGSEGNRLDLLQGLSGMYDENGDSRDDESDDEE